MKLVITMSLGLVGGQDSPAQYIEMFVVRGLGEVSRRTGINPLARSVSRLRSANVGGRMYTPADLRYRD